VDIGDHGQTWKSGQTICHPFGRMRKKIGPESSTIHRWESAETLQANTIRTRNYNGSQAFEVSCGRKGGRVSERVGIQQDIEDLLRGGHRNAQRVSSSVQVLQLQHPPLVLLASSWVAYCFPNLFRCRSVRPLTSAAPGSTT
jgi:hypothetical protein